MRYVAGVKRYYSVLTSVALVLSAHAFILCCCFQSIPGPTAHNGFLLSIYRRHVYLQRCCVSIRAIIMLFAFNRSQACVFTLLLLSLYRRPVCLYFVYIQSIAGLRICKVLAFNRSQSHVFSRPVYLLCFCFQSIEGPCI